MRRLALLSLLALALAGCRREDWREIVLPLPPGVPAERAAEALRALDLQTPPVVVPRGEALAVRYNSMHVAPRNLTHTLERLAEP